MIIGNIAATFAPALTFIENEYRILAFYNQNELHAVKVGDRAEFTLESLPGRIIHAKVHSIILNNAEGQILPTGAVPDTGRQLSSSAGQRFAVRYEVTGDDKSLMLPSGAQGDGAVYTDSWHAIHVVRMVILRIGAKLNYLIFKLH
jgi:multidrug resistance efflux pump